MVDWKALPDTMLSNYVERYETGGVQPHPRLRFVDGEGRACLAAALCGARRATDVAPAAAALGCPFPGGALETISRGFESGRLMPAELYDICVLELVRRRARTKGGRPGGRPARAGRRSAPPLRVATPA